MKGLWLAWWCGAVWTSSVVAVEDAAPVVAVEDAAPVVAVREGKVSGITDTSTNGRRFHAYYGIPFAKPPLGERRLQDPVGGGPWESVRDGSKMPPPCLPVSLKYLVLGKEVRPQDVTGDEDCLYLNIFTPQGFDESSRIPVMVWIHGGAFLSGGSYEYLPHVLMNHNVILVVLQYRLGILGFLSTEDEVMPGNLGLKDQILALTWLQDNVHNFGGDPHTVTVFGESAGGVFAHYLMLSPKAKGLFSRVIMQSGTALASVAHMAAGQYKNVAHQVARNLGCPEGGSSRELLRCLQEVDARVLAVSIQDLMVWLFMPIVTVPRVDGEYIPDDPLAMMTRGELNAVDVMAGMTQHEGAMVTHPLYMRPDVLKSLQDNFTTVGPISLIVDADIPDPLAYTTAMYTHYLGPNFVVDQQSADQITQLLTDHHFGVPLDLTTQLHAIAAASVNPVPATFRYELTHRGDLSFGDFFGIDVGKDWVTHADDLLYLWEGGPLLSPPWLGEPRRLQHPDDTALSTIITTMWTNFATTGHPTPDASLGFEWEAARPDNLHYLSLSAHPTMAPDKRQHVRALHASLASMVENAATNHREEL